MHKVCGKGRAGLEGQALRLDRAAPCIQYDWKPHSNKSSSHTLAVTRHCAVPRGPMCAWSGRPCCLATRQPRPCPKVLPSRQRVQGMQQDQVAPLTYCYRPPLVPFVSYMNAENRWNTVIIC